MAEQDDTPSKRGRLASASVFRPGRPPAERMPQSTDLVVGRNIFTDSYPLALFSSARVWESLDSAVLDGDHLAGNGLFTNPDQSPAGAAFDILRTRVAQAMAERGWKRIGITSPTHGCGKSFTATNLALALARRAGSRTVLIDLDLRHPGLHSLLGLTPPGSLREFLEGTLPMDKLFLRVGKTLAIALNAEAVPESGDVLHNSDATQALESMETMLEPEITIFDLPPALISDDVLAMKGKVDAILIVADGTRTTAADIRACETLFENRIPLMGVVLNRAQDRGLGRLRHDRG